jgi:hypothetical protein
MNRQLSIFSTLERAVARSMAEFLLILTTTIAAEPHAAPFGHRSSELSLNLT